MQRSVRYWTPGRRSIALWIVERVRQLAWGQAARAAWSPEVSVVSLHQVAAASTVTGHNCHVVLQTLTTGIAGRGSDRLQTELAEAAEAALGDRIVAGRRRHRQA